MDISYFVHKYIVEYWNNNNRQTVMSGGDNYGDRTMKRFEVLVWRACKMKQLNLEVLIEDNNSYNLVE